MRWGDGREAPLCTKYSAQTRRRDIPGGKRMGKNVPGRERHVKRPCGRRGHGHVESLQRLRGWVGAEVKSEGEYSLEGRMGLKG